MTTTTRKVWTVSEIRNLLQTNDTMVARSIVKLYEYQTADEQATRTANTDNGMGFNKADARFYSDLAEFLKGGDWTVDESFGDTVEASRRTWDSYRDGIMKYARQLTKIANLQTA